MTQIHFCIVCTGLGIDEDANSCSCCEGRGELPRVCLECAQIPPEEDCSKCQAYNTLELE